MCTFVAIQFITVRFLARTVDQWCGETNLVWPKKIGGWSSGYCLRKCCIVLYIFRSASRVEFEPEQTGQTVERGQSKSNILVMSSLARPRQSGFDQSKNRSEMESRPAYIS